MNLHANLIGRFGNQCFIYCAARKLAEQNGWTFTHSPWIGDRIFDLPVSMNGVTADKMFEGYGQRDSDLLYSRRDVLNWLRLKPEVQAQLDTFVPHGEILAHRRVGDFPGSGYPVVSERSYYQAAEKFGFNPAAVQFVREETPLTNPDFTGDLAFLPDFYRMMRAKVLFRANSSFSWWASTLGEALTFSPNIRDKRGGFESDCDFDWGNSQRLANLEFTTDLHLFREEDRYDYHLAFDAQVMDAGGYKGDFAAEIHRRYRCYVHVIEPCERLALDLNHRFRDNVKLTVVHGALGGNNRTDTLKVKGDMTSIFAEGQSEQIDVFDVADMASPHMRGYDLLKLNIEGMEYEVLECILECGIASRFRNIQVQFHKVVPDYARRYIAIREGLLKTHHLTFDEPFCWQNFELLA